MWPLLAVAACACAALWLLRAPLRRWRRLLALSARLPGPALPRLSLGARPLAELRDICRRYGTPCRLWVGSRLYVVLGDADHAEAVLGDDAFHQSDHPMADAMRPFTGPALVTAETASGWHRRRRLVEDALTTRWLESQLVWLQRVAERLASALMLQLSRQPSQQVEGAAAERELSACALDALAGCLLGHQARATGRPIAGFPHHFLQAARLVTQQAEGWPRALRCPLVGLTSLGEERSRLVRQLRGHIAAAIDSATHSSTRDQERHIALSWERAAEAGDDPDRLPGSALEHLLLDEREEEEGEAEGEPRRVVTEELAGLLLLGQPATKAALLSTLRLLALHPQVQTEASSDPELLRRCVLEALRLEPPLPLLGRRLCSDVTLQLPFAGGQVKQLVLPAGCTALMVAPLVHRDPKHWPDPDTFQPDRFLEEAAEVSHSFCYLSFGGGPRRCPATQLALEQVVTTLEGLLAAFCVVPSEELQTPVAPPSGRPLQLRLLLRP